MGVVPSCIVLQNVDLGLFPVIFASLPPYDNRALEKFFFCYSDEYLDNACGIQTTVLLFMLIEHFER